VNPEENHAGPLEWNPALNGNLPEVFAQRQHDTTFRLGAVEKGRILRSGAIGPSPKHIVAVGAKRLDNRLREILVSQNTQLR
jgi:hypothetical protein